MVPAEFRLNNCLNCDAGMMAREMSSPRARSMSGRLTTPGGTEIAGTPQPGAKASPGAAKKQMAPLDIGQPKGGAQPGNMALGVAAGPSAEARLQAATQLRKLNRNSRSNSETGLNSILKGTRAPSPEVLQSVPSESLMPDGGSSMHHTPASAGFNSSAAEPEPELEGVDEELGNAKARP